MSITMVTSLISILTIAQASLTSVTVTENQYSGNDSTFTPVTVQDRPQTLESYVREYYANEPMLAEIARCESNFRQFDSNGKILRGGVNPDDVGIMQINEVYHYKRAQKLGFDLRTLDGNLAYATYLYEKESYGPWSSSAKCWNKSTAFKELSQR